MSRFRELAFALALLAAAVVQAQPQPSDRFAGVGRAATPAEVTAWDIDVRPDFKGLPKGAGSVAKGQDVWEGKCASCHGVFGESNEVFSPLVGGTTAEDIKNGRVANLRRSDYPGRTTMMKVATVSTLWDYINRAMPWDKPKSLTTEEVYAVTAFLLNLSGVVPDDYVLSDRNIAEVQQRMPNRNGMTTAHAMWPGAGIPGQAAKPDVAATACMKDCPVEAKVASSLPVFARNAHGNLADQNRPVGAQRGAQTAGVPGPAAPAASPAASGPAMPKDLLSKNSCTACHAPDRKMIGPSWAEIAAKHAGKSEYLTGKIKAGGSGVWGSMPMPPQDISVEEAKKIADWLAAGGGR